MLFNMPQYEKYKLVVTVTGLKPLKGDLYIALHQRPQFFQVPDSAFMKTIIPVDADTETVLFNNVPDGRYALAVYHDENLNGLIDVNEIGVPKEGYGFSYNQKASGKPKFEQAAFDLSRNDTIEMKMIYHPAPNQKKEPEKK